MKKDKNNRRKKKTKVKDGKECNGSDDPYDKKFFAGTDKPTYKHGYAKVKDKAGNESDVFDWHMKASYKS